MEELKQPQRPSTSTGKRKPELPLGDEEVRISSATPGRRVPMNAGAVVKREKARYSPKQTESGTVQSPLRVERPSTPIELEQTKPPAIKKSLVDRPRTPKIP